MKRLFAVAAMLMAALLLALPASAQTFPKLTGRVVDAANILDPAQEAAITAKLEALNTQSGRQLVVATIPDLEGYDIADYGYQLGRAWGIGQKGKDDGSLLIVAPNDRKVRIEVGYGVEGILTDAMSSIIIRQDITPRFKANDFPGGIAAGVDRISALLSLPPEEARKQALAAEKAQKSGTSAGEVVTVIFWLVIIFFVIVPMFARGRGGRRYRSGGGPVVIWGGGDSGGSSWGSGGGWGGGGGGGFSGGGGSFGGGGSSGSW